VMAGRKPMMLWVLPEPTSKGLAATLTAGLIAYLGVDTVWSLIRGWMNLVEAASHATTFDELREAGARFGKVMGQNAARAFVMLATAAIGNTVGLAVKGPRLPGSSQAALLAESQGGFRLISLAEVESVAVSSEGAFTIALAPGAVAMTSHGLGRGISEPRWRRRGTSTTSPPTSGGVPPPLAVRGCRSFRSSSPRPYVAANRIRVQGHKGPHPREYHEKVYEALKEATRNCSNIQQCRADLAKALEKLAKEIVTP